MWQLARVADDLGIPVMTYGLRVDFRGEPFPGSAALLALADSLREIRTICHCGRKATMVGRQDSAGAVVRRRLPDLGEGLAADNAVGDRQTRCVDQLVFC